MSHFTFIPSNEEDRCSACGRNHRKLRVIHGYRLGNGCAEDYRLFLSHPNSEANVWRGYEKNYQKIVAMRTRIASHG